MVEINKKIYDKIFEYAKQSDGEIGGLLLGYIRRDGECKITNIVLLKQIRTRLGFEINDDDMMEFTKNANEKTLKSVIGWWHSHGQYAVIWSPDDDRTFSKLCDFFNGYCVGVVVNNYKQTRFRVDIKHKSGRNYIVDNVNPNIIGNFNLSGIMSLKISKEVEEKVTTDNRAEVDWDDCPRCKGSGLIFRKRYGNKQIENYVENMFG